MHSLECIWFKADKLFYRVDIVLHGYYAGKGHNHGTTWAGTRFIKSEQTVL